MKKKLILVFASLLLAFSSITTYAHSDDRMNNPSGKISNRYNVTLDVLQNKLGEYMKSQGLNLKIGSREYYDYIVSELLEHKDKKLSAIADYDLIHAYMVEYKVAYDDFMYFDELVRTDKRSLTAVEPLITGNPCIKYNSDDGNVEFSVSNAFLDQTIDQISKRNKAEDKLYDSAKFVTQKKIAGYSGAKAAEYAIKYAQSHNKSYPSFESPFSGGDCTNFVSQCLFAGGLSMTGSNTIEGIYDSTSDWYCIHTGTVSGYRKYALSTSWIRVSDFRKYMEKIASTYNRTTVSYLVKTCHVGDAVQIRDKTTGTPYHTIIISKKDDSTAYFCGHTNPRKNVNLYDYLDEKNDYFLLFDFS